MSTVKSVLVTGGTGSFGKGFVRRILEIAPDLERLVIFSRDELKQFEMAQIFSPGRYPRYVISSATSGTRTACAGRWRNRHRRPRGRFEAGAGRGV